MGSTGMNDHVGTVRVHPETRDVAICRDGGCWRGPEWLVVPVSGEEPRYERMVDQIHTWPVVYEPQEPIWP